MKKPKRKITNDAELAAFAEEVDNGIETISEKMAACVEDGKKISALQADIEALKAENKTLRKSVKKGLTIINRGSWRETDKKAAMNETWGRFFQGMWEAAYGAKESARKYLVEKIHATPVKAKANGDPDGWDEPRKENLFFHKNQKAGISAAPLTGDDSVGSYYGSYTVPVPMAEDIIRVAGENSILMPLVQRMPMTSATMILPATASTATFTKLTNQNTDITEKNSPTFTKPTLTAEIYAGFVVWVEEFAEDSIVDIGMLLKTMYAEAWAQKFDDLCLIDSTYGVTGSVTGSTVHVHRMSSTAFSDLSPEDLLQAKKKIKTKAFRRGARYFMHMTNWDTLDGAKNAVGDYYFGALAGKPEDTAFRYPVMMPDCMLDIDESAKDSTVALFGNPQSIVWGDRKGLEFRVYDQTQSNAESSQIIFRIKVRAAFLNTQPTGWAQIKTAAS